MKYSKAERSKIEAALQIIADKQPVHDTTIDSASVTKEFLLLYFSNLNATREHFVVMFLDSQHRLLKTEVMFQGTLDGAAVYPREVVKRALELNSAAVIFAHNHPSGESSPSSADRRITDKLVAGCQLLDIRVLDHVIVAGAKTYSFAEEGLL